MFLGCLGSDQAVDKILYNQVSGALMRLAPAATTGRFDLKAVTCLKNSLAFWRVYLTILQDFTRCAGLTTNHAEARVADAFGCEVDAHW